MATPQLNIPIRVNLDDFRKGMNEASNLSATATRQIAKRVIDMNASFLSTTAQVGAMVGGFRTFLGVIGPITAAVLAVKGVFDLMSYATDLARERIEEFNKTAERAGRAGVSTDFFQRMTQSGERLKLTVDDVNEALDRFARQSQDRLGGSALTKRIEELVEAGNFVGNAGTGAFAGALGNEAKLRALVDMITVALERGERLAALDLAEKAFGSKVADNLRANSTYLREMLETADKIAASKIVNEEEIGRAIDLKLRLEEAQKVLAEKFKPIQQDLAKLGMEYQESWVNVYTNLAKAVEVGNQLYAALKSIPDVLAQAGNSPFWTKLRQWFEARGLNSDPASLGLTTIDTANAGSPAARKVAGMLNDPAAVKRAMQEAIDVETKARGDRSKAPVTPKPETGNERDPFETALDAGERRIALVRADTSAIGLNSEARDRARIVANLEEAAKRANAAAGKELYGVTEATNPKITEQADRMLAAARAAREQQTAFEAVQDSLRFFGNEIIGVLDRIGQKGQSFASIMSDVLRSVSRQLFTAAITGEGAFGKLFGLSGTNGGVGGIMGAIGSLFTGKAEGGYISGPGTGTSDSIPARLSNGEFVVRASETARHRPLLEAINTGRVASFAEGGIVGSAPTMTLSPLASQSLTIAPQISVTVEGGSRGPQADQAMGEAVARQVEGAVRQLVIKEVRTQIRPGGILSR